MEQSLENGQNMILRDEAGKFKEGTPSPNPSGKPKGVKDKVNTIRLAFFNAFEETGSVAALKEWVNYSDSNRCQFYKMLLSLLPKDIKIEDESYNNRTTIVYFGQKGMKPELNSQNFNNTVIDSEPVKPEI